MLVTDIQVTHYHYDNHHARHCANVVLSLIDRTINLYCQINLPPYENSDARTRGFASEAARQIKRMPEFRSGQQELQFADHLMSRH